MERTLLVESDDAVEQYLRAVGEMLEEVFEAARGCRDVPPHADDTAGDVTVYATGWP